VAEVGSFFKLLFAFVLVIANRNLDPGYFRFVAKWESSLRNQITQSLTQKKHKCSPSRVDEPIRDLPIGQIVSRSKRKPVAYARQ